MLENEFKKNSLKRERLSFSFTSPIHQSIPNNSPKSSHSVLVLSIMTIRIIATQILVLDSKQRNQSLLVAVERLTPWRWIGFRDNMTWFCHVWPFVNTRPHVVMFAMKLLAQTVGELPATDLFYSLKCNPYPKRTPNCGGCLASVLLVPKICVTYLHEFVLANRHYSSFVFCCMG